MCRARFRVQPPRLSAASPPRVAARLNRVGEKSLAKGEVEIKPRGGALQSVKTESAVEAVIKLLEEGNAGLRGV